MAAPRPSASAPRLSSPPPAAPLSSPPSVVSPKQFAVLSKTPQGKQSIKMVSMEKIQELIARRQALDNAVQQVVTEAPTTLPTVQIKVQSPFALSSSSSRTKVRPCTAATMAVKHPIPAISASTSHGRCIDSTRTNAVIPQSQLTTRAVGLPVVTTAPTALVSIKTTPVIHSTVANRVPCNASSASVISQLGTVSLSTVPTTVQVLAAPTVSSSSTTPHTASGVSPAKKPRMAQQYQQVTEMLSPTKSVNLAKVKEQGLVLIRTSEGQLQLVKSSQLPRSPPTLVQNNHTMQQPLVRVTSPQQQQQQQQCVRLAVPTSSVSSTHQSVQAIPNTSNQSRLVLQGGNKQTVALSSATSGHTLVTSVQQQQQAGVVIQPVNQLQLGAMNPALQPMLGAPAGQQPRLMLVNVNGQLMAQAVPQINLPAANMQIVNPSAGIQLLQPQQAAFVQPGFQLASPNTGLTSATGIRLLQQPALNIARPMLVRAPIAMVQGSAGNPVGVMQTGGAPIAMVQQAGGQVPMVLSGGVASAASIKGRQVVQQLPSGVVQAARSNGAVLNFNHVLQASNNNRQ